MRFKGQIPGEATRGLSIMSMELLNQAKSNEKSRAFQERSARIRYPGPFVALPHGKSSFVRFKHLFSSDSEQVSPPGPQPRSSALEQERNMAFVREKEEDVS
jgi:hypothetical protein